MFDMSETKNSISTQNLFTSSCVFNLMYIHLRKDVLLEGVNLINPQEKFADAYLK